MEDRQAVMDWVKSHGGKPIDYKDAIQVTATHSAVNTMLSVELASDEGLIRSEKDWTVPDHLADKIAFVDSISNPKKHSRTVKPSLTMDSDIVLDTGLVGDEVIARLYNVVDNGGSPDRSVGAMEYSGQSGFGVSDLKTNQEYNSVADNPIASDHIEGGNSSPDTESQLDVQVMYFGSHSATLYFWNFTGWIYQWAVAFVNAGVTNIPEVASISWGSPERETCSTSACSEKQVTSYLSETEAQFTKLAAMGITIVNSSGDSGAPNNPNMYCQTGESGLFGYPKNVNPSFPSTSEWVTSVGATFIVADSSNCPSSWNSKLCKNYQCACGSEEVATGYEYTKWTTGGGFSFLNNVADFQTDEVDAYLKSSAKHPASSDFNAGGRGYPDVSAIGHRCFITTGGRLSSVDGTSCSAPIFAGIVANLNEYQMSKGRPLLGYANPLWYKMAEEQPSTFKDITQGSNDQTEALNCNNFNLGYEATTGWDAVTGLGTPNVEEMRKYLDSKFAEKENSS